MLESLEWGGVGVLWLKHIDGDLKGSTDVLMPKIQCRDGAEECDIGTNS